jgi:AAA domain
MSDGPDKPDGEGLDLSPVIQMCADMKALEEAEQRGAEAAFADEAEEREAFLQWQESGREHQAGHGDGVVHIHDYRARQAAQAPRKFKLVPFDEITLSSKAVYLVKGIIPRVGLTLVYGAPKSGKSFWSFDLLMHVALGWEYRGRRVKQGAVVYIIMESADGFRARVEAFRQTHLGEGAEVPFYLISAPVALVADHPALIAAIREALGDVSPAAIALDTVNRSLTGSESSDQDMSNYVRAADALREAFSCAVVAIHHCGLDTSRPRGHTSLTGAADSQIAVKRNAADQIVSTVEFMKEGSAGAEIVSTLNIVEVGQDEDGEVVTSCVIVEAEGSALPKKPSKGPKLTDAAAIALQALGQAVEEAGEQAPASEHIPNVKVVRLSLWRSYAYQRGISTGDSERAKQAAFQRATEVLLGRKLAAVWGEFAWPIATV